MTDRSSKSTPECRVEVPVESLWWPRLNKHVQAYRMRLGDRRLWAVRPGMVRRIENDAIVVPVFQRKENTGDTDCPFCGRVHRGVPLDSVGAARCTSDDPRRPSGAIAYRRVRDRGEMVTEAMDWFLSWLRITPFGVCPAVYVNDVADLLGFPPRVLSEAKQRARIMGLVRTDRNDLDGGWRWLLTENVADRDSLTRPRGTV